MGVACMKGKQNKTKQSKIKNKQNQKQKQINKKQKPTLVGFDKVE